MTIAQRICTIIITTIITTHAFADAADSSRSDLHLDDYPNAKVAYLKIGGSLPMIITYDDEGLWIARIPERFSFQVQIDRMRKGDERQYDLIWFVKRNADGSTELKEAVAVTKGGTRFLSDKEFNLILKEYRFVSSVINDLDKERNLTEIQKAEQPGAAQPATQPADKPQAEDQPSPPTSKDAPR